MTTDGRLLVLYDADCGVCTRSASLLRKLDRDARLHLVPLQTAPPLVDLPPNAELAESLHVRDSQGRWSVGGAAAIRLAREVPALRPLAALARVPGVPRLADAAYALVAANRQRLSRLLGEDACRIPSRAGSGRPQLIIRSSPERAVTNDGPGSTARALR
jgi:predicted DCC family thiol-disulfide oxidoreductase YuxK